MAINGIRYRLHRRWFREPIVVVQVGEMRKPVRLGPFPPPPHPSEPQLVWRDARAEDLMNLPEPDGQPLPWPYRP